MRVLVTGVAGFIGFHVARALLGRGDEVIGVDNLNAYYDPSLKQARLDQLTGLPGMEFHKLDIADAAAMRTLFAETRPQRVIHLAAQAGVRHSLSHPEDYVQANLVGFLQILEGCRHARVEHLVYASSSSVYGSNTRRPFSVSQSVDHPVSLYAATKKANELMAHSYSHLYGLPATGLRFFTVYGPWGRPDMSAFIFTRKILAGEPIEIFNMGNHARDFTYVDDVTEGVLRTLDHAATPDPAWSSDAPDPGSSNAPWRVYNIGNSDPVPLLDFVAAIERACGRSAEKIMLPMQPGDVEATSADVTALAEAVGFRPHTPIETGIARFVSWYRKHYGV